MRFASAVSGGIVACGAHRIARAANTPDVWHSRPRLCPPSGALQNCAKSSWCGTDADRLCDATHGDQDTAEGGCATPGTAPAPSLLTGNGARTWHGRAWHRGAQLCVVVTLVWLAGVGASRAHAGDVFPVMVYPAPKAAAPPVLDGKLDDACWSTAPLVSGFTFFGQFKVTDIQTAFRVTYDDTALYVGITCDEPAADKLSKTGPGSRDSHAGVFRQEAIELFVDPFHDHATYYQIAMCLHETIFDGRATDTTWNSHTRVRTALGAKRWFMEVAVPWADVGVRRLRPGTVVGFNVCRDRNLGQKQWTNWSHMTVGFHDPPLFGHVVLEPTVKMLGTLTRELRKGGREGPIRVFSAAGFTGSAYVELGRGALAELDRVLTDLATVAAKEPPAVARGIRQRVADVRAAVKPIRARLTAAKTIDAADWIRMDRTIVTLSKRASKSLWQVRLATLLESI